MFEDLPGDAGGARRYQLLRWVQRRTLTDASGRPAAARRWATDPLVPLALLGAGGIALAGVGTAPAWVATWAVLGGLAGYTLSGSV